MQCKDFWELYETKGITLDMGEHLEVCGNCRKALQVETLLILHVSRLPTYRAPDRLWTKVSEELAP